MTFLTKWIGCQLHEVKTILYTVIPLSNVLK